MRERFTVLAQAASSSPRRREEPSLRESAFDAAPGAQIVVDADGVLVLANLAARALFRLAAGDVGRQILDLEVSYRPVELSPHIEDVREHRRVVAVPGAMMTDAEGEPRTYDIQLVPLTAEGELVGVGVTYSDVTAPQSCATSSRCPATSSSGHTRSSSRRWRTSRPGVAVAVLDADQRVQVWNDHACDLWGLRADEARGRHFIDLDIGLPVERLRRPIRALLAGGDGGGQELTVEALNRRGNSVPVRVTCLPMVVAEGDVNGVIVLMDDRSGARDS